MGANREDGANPSRSRRCNRGRKPLREPLFGGRPGDKTPGDRPELDGKARRVGRSGSQKTCRLHIRYSRKAGQDRRTWPEAPKRHGPRVPCEGAIKQAGCSPPGQKTGGIFVFCGGEPGHAALEHWITTPQRAGYRREPKRDAASGGAFRPALRESRRSYQP